MPLAKREILKALLPGGKRKRSSPRNTSATGKKLPYKSGFPGKDFSEQNNSVFTEALKGGKHLRKRSPDATTKRGKGGSETDVRLKIAPVEGEKNRGGGGRIVTKGRGFYQRVGTQPIQRSGGTTLLHQRGPQIEETGRGSKTVQIPERRRPPKSRQQ